MRQKIALWGIYIRPQAMTRSNEAPLNRIFAMNWKDEYGSALILEDVWGTPGQDNRGEYKKLLTDAEFTKHTDRKFEETTMYFTLEEFVLEAQWLLRQFTSRRRDGRICANPGTTYNLGFANCQDFAKFVMDRLESSRYDWTDSKRLSQPFVLSSLEDEILKDLEDEANDDYHEAVSYAYNQVALSHEFSGITSFSSTANHW
ncbi:hypothetical protein PENVUL_c016G05979 [Penicillium vulpinum]|uniref:Uncharacterized protein n=1 Tax=Penicillium vulpinum TaxID=29845 RepID=A0A1V6RZC7_9EURO|nr:hypothetical protein PENVUL_c016G05979 [Penicillium vulpinum]